MLGITRRSHTVRLVNGETVVVTHDLLEAGKSGRGGWSKLQLMCIGIPWPPQKGWKQSAVGQAISRSDADRFLQLRNGNRPEKKTDLPSRLQIGPFVCKQCKRELPFESFDDSSKKDRIKKAICRDCCKELSKEAAAKRKRKRLQTRPCVCKQCKRELPFESFDESPKKDRIKKAICRDCCKELSKEVKATAKRLRKLGPKEVVNGKSYIGRNMWLKLLGFDSYREYLASPLWKEIRKRVYKAKGNRCSLCDTPATEFHHNRYHRNDLLGKKLRFIYPICRQCHEAIEFSDCKKQNMMQAKRGFMKRRKDVRQHKKK